MRRLIDNHTPDGSRVFLDIPEDSKSGERFGFTKENSNGERESFHLDPPAMYSAYLELKNHYEKPVTFSDYLKLRRHHGD